MQESLSRTEQKASNRVSQFFELHRVVKYFGSDPELDAYANRLPIGTKQIVGLPWVKNLHELDVFEDLKMQSLFPIPGRLPRVDDVDAELFRDRTVCMERALAICNTPDFIGLCVVHRTRTPNGIDRNGEVTEWSVRFMPVKPNLLDSYAMLQPGNNAQSVRTAIENLLRPDSSGDLLAASLPSL